MGGSYTHLKSKKNRTGNLAMCQAIEPSQRSKSAEGRHLQIGSFLKSPLYMKIQLSR
jgi:hypothetical protein